jgi:hypothetical protein
VPGDLSDAAGDVLASVSPRAFTEPVAVAAAAWRVWTCDSRTEAKGQRRNLSKR